mmetsp:Transcript_1470/g.2966  ORF Transcript_1470/g.2966 Transcript_1470/m.2966 type:complete len:205 (+) Transcript_1470:176-790(+)
MYSGPSDSANTCMVYSDAYPVCVSHSSHRSEVFFAKQSWMPPPTPVRTMSSMMSPATTSEKVRLSPKGYDRVMTGSVELKVPTGLVVSHVKDSTLEAMLKLPASSVATDPGSCTPMSPSSCGVRVKVQSSRSSVPPTTVSTRLLSEALPVVNTRSSMVSAMMGSLKVSVTVSASTLLTGPGIGWSKMMSSELSTLTRGLVTSYR